MPCNNENSDLSFEKILEKLTPAEREMILNLKNESIRGDIARVMVRNLSHGVGKFLRKKAKKEIGKEKSK